MEEEIKKQSKFKRGCLGCLVVGVIIPTIIILFIFIMLNLLSGSTFISPPIWGEVCDNETRKPIENAVIDICYRVNSINNSSHSILTKRNGKYFLRPRIIWGLPIRLKGEFPIPELNKREGQYFSAWFPGYKKYEIQTEGKKLLSGRHNIYLERPKTKEELSEANRGTERYRQWRPISNPIRPEDKILAVAELEFALKLLRKEMRSVFPGEGFWDIYGVYEDKEEWNALESRLKIEIKKTILSLNCEELVDEYKSYCKELKEKLIKEEE